MNRLLLLAVFLASACSRQPSAPAPATHAELGAHVFRTRCAICHGPDGRADTPVANAYPNANLADGRFAYGSSVDEVRSTIRQGVPGTPMLPMSSQLSEEEIEAVADHILGLSRP